jgi:hypothetical protein
MDDTSYKSLLPPNTDFLNPEGSTPVPDIPEIHTETPAPAPPPPDLTKTPEGPNLPDREAVLKDLGEKIDGFFGFARVRGGRIQESADVINRSRQPLEELKENGSSTKRMLQEIPSDTAHEAAQASAQIASRAEEQIDDTFRTMHSIDAGEQLAYIKTQEGQFTGEALETFKGEIREALKIEDQQAREDKLVELNNRIRAITTRVDERATESYSKSLTLQDGTKIRRGQIKSRIDTVQYVLPSLREKLGDSYHRVASMADEMGDSFHRFGIEAQHIESISLEFKLLAHTADELGVSMAQIFSALGAGKFI